MKLEKSCLNLTIDGKNGTRKKISFQKDGKINEKQLLYFNALFDENLRLRARFGEYAYFGAFRCSKSFSQQSAVHIINEVYPKCKTLYVRDTYDQLKDSVIKQFLDEHEYLGSFTYHKAERKAYYKNGSTIVFRAFDKDTGILSTEYDLIAVCQAEDISWDLFLQLFGRLSGTVLPRPLLLTEGNPASGNIKARYKDINRDILKRKGVYFLEGRTEDNPWVTKDYIQRLIDNYPKWWLDRYLYGLWDNREELIYSEFNPNEHIIDILDPKIIPDSYLRRNGFDWGWVNPTANLWGFVDYDGSLTIYDEYYQNKTLPEYVAKECNKHGKFLTAADHSMKGLKMPTKEDENKTVWSELERNGMLLIPCNKEELSNIILVNTLFKTNKLRITNNCVNLKREALNWKWKRLRLGSDKNLPEEPVDKDNHTCDALNYLVADLFGSKSVDTKKEEAYKRSLEFHNRYPNEGKEIQSLS